MLLLSYDCVSEITCPEPLSGIYTNPVPVNTTMTYLSTYTYSCMDGYSTDDELCTVCQANGMLSSPPPNCTRKCLE